MQASEAFYATTIGMCQSELVGYLLGVTLVLEFQGSDGDLAIKYFVGIFESAI